MSSTPTPLIAGNWKMNGTEASLAEVTALAQALQNEPTRARVAVCPPATLVERASQAALGSGVEIGGQDCRAEPFGAFTGDIAAEMLADAGATLVILGHSERRSGYGETDAAVCAKVTAAIRAGLEPIVCVGETLEERRAGKAVEVVQGQVTHSLPDDLHGRAFSVAYEPVWAIGSGLTPSLAEIGEVHQAIRETLLARFGDAGAGVAILYGGSVKPNNAAEILAVQDVGGALVGGASLKAADFLWIIRAV